MSGGHWNYSQHLQESSYALERIVKEHELMITIEHELDWGHSGDSCLECARLRVIAGLEDFFDGEGLSLTRAVEILRDESRNLCPRCQQRVR